MKEAKAPAQCPKGHPTRTQFGEYFCSKARCGEDMQATYGPTTLNLDELAAKPTAEVAFEHRKQLAKLPDGLTGDAATKWAQEKMVDLLPEAVANVAYDLRYGTDRQREAATDRVLKANGMDKRDTNASQGGQGLIVLNLTAEATSGVPWLQRLSKPSLTAAQSASDAEESEE